MRRILAIITAVIFCILATLWLVPKFLTINSYKPQIVKLLQDKTGMDIAIKGDIHLNIIPDFAFRVDDVAVGNKADLSIHVKSIDLQLKLLSLLKNKIEISAINITHPVINLANNEKQSSPAAKDKSKSVTSESAKTKAKYALKISQIRVSDGIVRIANKDSSKKPLTLKQIDIKASLDGDKIPFKFFASLDLNSALIALRSEGNLIINNNIITSELSLNIDNGKGFGKIEANLANTVPDVTISLNIDRLDLDKLLAKEQGIKSLTSGNNTPSEGSNFSWSKEKLPFDFVSKISGHVNFTVGQISYKDLVIKNFNSNNHFLHSKFTSESNFSLFGGNVASNSSIDIAGSNPVISAKINLTKLNSAEIAKSNKFSGAVSGNLYLNSSGDSQYQLVNNLSGKGKVNVDHGSFKGVDLVNMIRNVAASFTSAGSSSNSTDFTQMDGSFTINRGIIHNDDLTIKANGLELLGKGIVDLPNLIINYKLSPSVNTKGLDSIGNKITVSVSVKGSLFKPSYSPDLETPVKNIINDPTKALEVIKGLKKDIKNNKSDIKSQLKNELQNTILNGF